MPHAVFILFLFALGSCVGSFLNVVVWRLPQIEHDPDDRSLWRPFWRTLDGLSNPPSHCPKCKNRLKWYDNIPVLGWIKLGGKCRFCAQPISVRYPIVEAICGLIFVGYYVAFFILQSGPCAAQPVMIPDESLGTFMMVPRPLVFRLDWPMYMLYMAMIAGLLASSLIDAELFIIPIEIPWVLAFVGLIVHPLIDTPSVPGALNANPASAALAIGGAAGLVISIALWSRGLIPHSFPDGEPMQDLEPEEGEPPPRIWSRRELIGEMRKEMIFLLLPMLLAAAWWFAATRVSSIAPMWNKLVAMNSFSGLAGALLGALVGAFVVWVTRILGTLAFGRLAMGLGDVHLMLGVGAIIGAAGATVTFFVAPFFGILIALYMLLTGKKREIPYGPYLSLGAAFFLLFSCPILAWLTPGAKGLSLMVHEMFK